MHTSIAAGRRHFRSLLVMFTLSLLVIVGCGSSKAKAPVSAITTTTPPPTTAPGSVTATATATPPPATAPSSTSTLYTSTDGVYSLIYPTGWSKQALQDPDTSSAVGLSSPDGNEVLFVFPSTSHINASDYDTVDQSFLSQAIGATNVSISSSSGTLTLPSGTWTTIDAGGTFNATTFDFTQLAIDHGIETFFIYILTPDATASENVTTVFAPMLSSFRFLK